MSLTVSSLRALSHPVRLRMLSLLTGAPMSAAELARELDLTQANASYHLRSLLAAGVISEAGIEKVRGGTAKRYRYVVDADSSAKGLRGGEQLYAQALAAELVRRTALRRARGIGASTDAELWVDPQVWRDIRRRVADAMTDLHKAARPPRTEGTSRVSATIAMFEMEVGP